VRRPLLVAIAFAAIAAVAATDQGVAFQLDPQRTTVTFTLGEVLHTVRGGFRLKQGSLGLDPASGKLTGEIVVDARSGESGSGMRDRKMHREVLEVAFHPDRVDGTVLLKENPQCKSMELSTFTDLTMR
jgi:polyisoprenoid-binding protein YceI